MRRPAPLPGTPPPPRPAPATIKPGAPRPPRRSARRKPVRQTLAEVAERGGLTLVLGAGISLSHGVPGWTALVNRLWGEVHPHTPLGEDSPLTQMPTVALERIAQALGPEAFVEALRSHLYANVIRPTRKVLQQRPGHALRGGFRTGEGARARCGPTHQARHHLQRGRSAGAGHADPRARPGGPQGRGAREPSPRARHRRSAPALLPPARLPAGARQRPLARGEPGRARLHRGPVLARGRHAPLLRQPGDGLRAPRHALRLRRTLDDRSQRPALAGGSRGRARGRQARAVPERERRGGRDADAACRAPGPAAPLLDPRRSATIRADTSRRTSRRAASFRSSSNAAGAPATWRPCGTRCCRETRSGAAPAERHTRVPSWMRSSRSPFIGAPRGLRSRRREERAVDRVVAVLVHHVEVPDVAPSRDQAGRARAAVDVVADAGRPGAGADRPDRLEGPSSKMSSR